jgi:hypothetical protein
MVNLHWPASLLEELAAALAPLVPLPELSVHRLLRGVRLAEVLAA